MAWPTTAIVTTSMDAGTDSPATARAEIKQMADNVNDIMNSRSAASGIASLNSTGRVPTNELGSGTATAGYVLTAQSGADPAWVSTASFDTGTRVAFQQTTAPTGWTKDTTAALNDSIMRIVTGTASSGGSTGWSAASVGATTLTESQIPSHTHTQIRLTTGSGGISAGATTTNATPSNLNATSATGGGGSHTHSWPSIKYNDFIIASKN
jgi:hypothetical protein